MDRWSGACVRDRRMMSPYLTLGRPPQNDCSAQAREANRQVEFCRTNTHVP